MSQLEIACCSIAYFACMCLLDYSAELHEHVASIKGGTHASTYVLCRTVRIYMYVLEI